MDFSIPPGASIRGGYPDSALRACGFFRPLPQGPASGWLRWAPPSGPQLVLRRSSTEPMRLWISPFPPGASIEGGCPDSALRACGFFRPLPERPAPEWLGFLQPQRVGTPTEPMRLWISPFPQGPAKEVLLGWCGMLSGSHYQRVPGQRASSLRPGAWPF